MIGPAPATSRASASVEAFAWGLGLGPDRAALAGDLAGLFCSGLDESASPRRRAASLHHDGTPLQLSASLQRGSGGARFIVEPGPLSEPVPRQIDRALRLVGSACASLGWDDARRESGPLVRSLLPADPAETESWWGGLWLGAVVTARHVGLRVYVNLRSGDAMDRWRRVGRLFAALSGEPVCGALRAIVERASDHARPVGIGLDLVDGARAGLKLYVSPERTDHGALRHMLGVPASQANPVFDVLLSPPAEPLPPYATTVCYDVDLSGPLGADAVRRTKLDADAAVFFRDDRGALAAARRLARLAHPALDLSDLDGLAAALGESAAGRAVQYVGVGFAGGVANVNVYARPSGLARC